MKIEIVSLNVGMPAILRHEKIELMSGIMKTSVGDGPLPLSELGFQGDGQADLVHHGGPDKAVCVYSYEHYPYWEQELNSPLDYGAFGENLTVLGLTEDRVCIGDVYAIGDIRVQVSQPRQPCHKLAKRYNRPDLALLVQQAGFTGFYFRVLVPGVFDCKQPLTLVERNPAEVTVVEANHTYYIDKHNLAGIHRLLGVQELSSSWRSSLEQRLLGV